MMKMRFILLQELINNFKYKKGRSNLSTAPVFYLFGFFIAYYGFIIFVHLKERHSFFQIISLSR